MDVIVLDTKYKIKSAIKWC